MIATIQEFRDPNKLKRMILEGDSRTLVLLKDSESKLSKMVENLENNLKKIIDKHFKENNRQTL